MARNLASRKYLMTINNPVNHGFTHVSIKHMTRLSILITKSNFVRMIKQAQPEELNGLLFQEVLFYKELST